MSFRPTRQPVRATLSWRQRLYEIVPVLCVGAFLLGMPSTVSVAKDKDSEQSQVSAAVSTQALVTSTATNAGTTTNVAGVDKLADDRIDSSDYGSFVENPTGSQISFTRLSDGYHTGSATERYPRPALSLIKLYIADYVFEHGTDLEKVKALDMIRTSNDSSAEELYLLYPDSITEIADKYGLWSTHPSDEGWGYSVTSMYDVVKFIEIKKQQDPTSPVLSAMKEAHEVADDGTSQNFGTAVLPGVVGTKWGWSNDLQLHSSVSYGDDFVVAAAVLGSADDLTALVKHRVEPLLEKQN